MVLLEKPAKPVWWKFRDKSAGGRQTSILDYARRNVTQGSMAQIAPDDEHDWSPPVELTLCRKGFLIRTDKVENREIVRRSIRDLTCSYPESNFERARKKHAQNQWGKNLRTVEKAPLQVFCSYKNQSPEEMFLEGKAQEIGEKSDWLTTMQEGSNANHNKTLRAKNANYVLIPKFFLLEQLKNRGHVEIINENTNGEPMAETLQFNPNRSLVETERRPQISATNFALHHLRTTGGAVLVLPVGCGKTVCAIYTAMQLRVCTLVVVGNVDLMDQWIDRIKEYCPGARIGRIQSTTCEVDDCDFVIASTTSLAERAYSPEKLRKIGLVIFDEAHHAAAPTFLTAVWQVAAPYMLALSQDPTRQDGMTNVLYHFFSFNVFIVLPSLPPGIKLYDINHKFQRRCFIQDADCVAAAKLKERRHNAGQDNDMLKYCEALASFDKKYFAAATMSAAPIAVQLQSDPNPPLPNPALPGVAAYHAHSPWQEQFCKDDIKNLTYTQVYQTIQCDAHRNAVMVAYIKQFLKENNAENIRRPTVEEINDLSSESVYEPNRFHVNVRINIPQTTSEASTSGSILKQVHICTRDELQNMVQVERQILVLASEKEHIDSFHDRLVKSGIDERMIGVYVGGENSKLTREEKTELLARRILLATYPMAAEGLDIATLNVVAFITPRSSITDQAIGRGLRDKLNPLVMPIVLDFVDEWCQMTRNMHFARCKSYNFYKAIRVNVEDFSTYDATGAVCWKKPAQNRTQRLAAKRIVDRKQKRDDAAAIKNALKVLHPKKKRKVVASAVCINLEAESDTDKTEIDDEIGQAIKKRKVDQQETIDEEATVDEEMTIDDEKLDEELTIDDEATVEEEEEDDSVSELNEF